jgi:hypothetical protein
MLVTTFLAKHDACPEGRAFALQHRTMEQVWEACARVDWMLWILERTKRMPPRMSRLFACWCARHTPLADGRAVWDLTEERSRNAVVVAEAYARGGATDVELAAAWDAAWAAAGAAAWAAARDAATAAQCREIRRFIPSLTKWTAPKRKARK